MTNIRRIKSVASDVALLADKRRYWRCQNCSQEDTRPHPTSKHASGSEWPIRSCALLRYLFIRSVDSSGVSGDGVENLQHTGEATGDMVDEREGLRKRIVKLGRMARCMSRGIPFRNVVAVAKQKCIIRGAGVNAHVDRSGDVRTFNRGGYETVTISFTFRAIVTRRHIEALQVGVLGWIDADVDGCVKAWWACTDDNAESVVVRLFMTASSTNATDEPYLRSFTSPPPRTPPPALGLSSSSLLSS